MSKNTFSFSKIVGPCAILEEGTHKGRLTSIRVHPEHEDRLEVVFTIEGTPYAQNLFINPAAGKTMSQAQFFGQMIQQATGIYNVDEAVAHAMENDIDVSVEYRNGFVNVNPGIVRPNGNGRTTVSPIDSEDDLPI